MYSACCHSLKWPFHKQKCGRFDKDHGNLPKLACNVDSSLMLQIPILTYFGNSPIYNAQEG